MTLTLRGRIFLTLAPLMILLVLLGGVGLALILGLGGHIDAILRENYDSIQAMERLNEALERIDSSFQFTLAGREPAARIQYQENWRPYRQALHIEQNNITVPGEREQVALLTGLTERYQRQGDAFYARQAQDPLRREDYFESTGLLQTFKEIKSASGRILRLNQDHMEKASSRAKRTATASEIGLGIGLAAALLLAAMSASRTVRAILRPIQALTQATLDISEGRLDQVVAYPARDEVGRLAAAFNDMSQRLHASDKSVHEYTALLLRANERLTREIKEREQAEQSRQKAEEKYRSIFENAVEGIHQSTPEGRYLTVNPALAHMYGYASPDEMIRAVQDIGQQMYVDPGRRAEFGRLLKEHGAVQGFEAQALRKDGSTLWISMTARAVRDPGGAVLCYEGFTRDITQRKQAEDELRRLNRAHRALSSCNQALIRATEEDPWIQQVCRLIVEEAGYRMCWVGTAENDEGKTVRPIAQAGLDQGYLSAANVTWADTERGHGPTGTCIRTGEVQVGRNFAQDPRLAPWRAEALKRGYASSIAIPLALDSGPFGALTIYSAEPDAFGEKEVALLSELASDLMFGIVSLRTRIERARAEEEVRAINAQLEQRVVARTAELQAANQIKDGLLLREQAVTAELEAAHERELGIGYRIQKLLLQDQAPVDVPGLEVAALTIPSQQIDGDFYAFYGHEDRTLDLIVADVMGKGIAAALLGAATKNHFIEALCHLMALSRAKDTEGALPQPKEIVTLAHAEMVQHLINLESFVTLCYVRFDLNRRRLDFVDCGHTGLIHLHAATGTCEVIHGDNLPLGVRAGEIYEQISTPLQPGDLLLLYSDGVTEARNQAGELFGEDRLVQCVQRHSGVGPQALVAAVREAALAFAGSDRLADDLTCVAIRVVETELPTVLAKLEIRSDLKELGRSREFVRAACSALPGAPLAEECVGQLELAVTEACSNIMRHAYHGRADQWIYLEAEALPGSVTIRLHHLGDPLDPSKVSPPAFDGSRESGFGIYLIAHSVDEVRYYRDARGRHCVALTKRRG